MGIAPAAMTALADIFRPASVDRPHDFPLLRSALLNCSSFHSPVHNHSWSSSFLSQFSFCPSLSPSPSLGCPLPSEPELSVRVNIVFVPFVVLSLFSDSEEHLSYLSVLLISCSHFAYILVCLGPLCRGAFISSASWLSGSSCLYLEGRRRSQRPPPVCGRSLGIRFAGCYFCFACWSSSRLCPRRDPSLLVGAR